MTAGPELAAHATVARSPAIAPGQLVEVVAGEDDARNLVNMRLGFGANRTFADQRLLEFIEAALVPSLLHSKPQSLGQFPRPPVITISPKTLLLPTTTASPFKR